MFTIAILLCSLFLILILVGQSVDKSKGGHLTEQTVPRYIWLSVTVIIILITSWAYLEKRSIKKAK